MPKQEKKFKGKLLSLRLVIVLGFILLIFFSVSLGKEMYHKYQINKEIKEVEEEIATIEEKNKEMRDLIQYLNTDAFKEIQARQQLGLQKEGESAVAIQSTPVNEELKSGEITTNNIDVRSNPKKWWDYFFKK